VTLTRHTGPDAFRPRYPLASTRRARPLHTPAAR